ncbi:hypothetical protein [Pseudoalteromonas arctica]|uniref:hypothetical protein n=1 Tax=Pseudoalteromonas arctica TaxID=394751 RepID=UPI00026D1995|nr:hypothetical protein [Pseudoalteromonas arctica]
MSDVKVWRANHEGINYAAKVEGIKLELTRESGSRESFGGKSLLASHFLTKSKWQDHVKQFFGEHIYGEIYNQLEIAQTEFKNSVKNT